MAKPLSLARSSLVIEVQESIKQLIFERKLKPGDALPTEYELTEVLGVSRNSLREALKVLEATGVVVIRRGHGMSVGEMNLNALISELVFHARLSAADGTKELRNLMDLREALESSLLHRVAPMLEAAELAGILAAVEQMESAAADGQFSPEADKAFHERLYQPLDNPFISQLLSAFWMVLRLLENDLAPSVETPAQTAGHHREIYTALKAHDLDAVDAAMAGHFNGIKKRLEPVADASEA